MKFNLWYGKTPEVPWQPRNFGLKIPYDINQKSPKVIRSIPCLPGYLKQEIPISSMNTQKSYTDPVPNGIPEGLKS